MTKPKQPSNAPSYSCRLWHDRGAVYVELASGLITKFDKTEGALSKVLKLLERESRAGQSPRTAGRSKATLPLVAKKARKPITKSVVADEDKAKATDFLKKRGLI